MISKGDRERRRADEVLFGAAAQPALCRAVGDLSWLLGRGYTERAALKLVGDRHGLEARQRQAVARAACSDAALASRRARRLEPPACRGGIAIDGFNLLVTLESALDGGVVLACRDGCYRDLASVHGRYRRRERTEQAASLVATLLDDWGITRARWLLDRPVAASGEVRAVLERVFASARCAHVVELAFDPDGELARGAWPVASSDSRVLDQAAHSVNVAAAAVDGCAPAAFLVHLEAPPREDGAPGAR